MPATRECSSECVNREPIQWKTKRKRKYHTILRKEPKLCLCVCLFDIFVCSSCPCLHGVFHVCTRRLKKTVIESNQNQFFHTLDLDFGEIRKRPNMLCSCCDDRPPAVLLLLLLLAAKGAAAGIVDGVESDFFLLNKSLT